MNKTCHAMFIGQGISGLAEDQVVNNFTFRHTSEQGALAAADYTEVRAAVSAFYEQSGAQGTQPAQTHPIGSYISPWVNRAATLRLYDMSQAKPRVPVTSSITLGTANATSGLPEECCVCLSFRTDVPNTARRRGRVFIGPVTLGNDAVVMSGPDNGNCRVALAFQRDLTRAANRLKMMSVGMRWVTLSKYDSDSTVHPVTYAWCDDAFDTQRRRGPKPGTRTALQLDA